MSLPFDAGPDQGLSRPLNPTRKETSALPAPIDHAMEAIPLRPTVRRLDADQVFRNPIPTTISWRPNFRVWRRPKEPARALWKHGPTFRRLDARQLLP